MGIDIVNTNLELIKTTDNFYYWYLDYRFEDDTGGAYLNSTLYKTDKKAIKALISNNIKWKILEYRTDNQNILKENNNEK